MRRLADTCLAWLAVLILGGLPPPALAVGELPETVVLDQLAQYYESVEFDHDLHLDVADGCGACHHHTTGSPPESEACATCHDEGEPAETVRCVDCHTTEPFSASHMAELEQGPQWFHVDKPGLKGAYHRSCLGCHEEMGAPTGCEDCHGRTPAGDALFHAEAGRPGGQREASHH